MQKDVENPEFIQVVNFGFIVSLKNNGTKYLLVIDDLCEEVCKSKAFVDNATAGRHRGLNTSYIKHNLFLQSKLGRDVPQMQMFSSLSLAQKSLSSFFANA